MQDTWYCSENYYSFWGFFSDNLWPFISEESWGKLNVIIGKQNINRVRDLNISSASVILTGFWNCFGRCKLQNTWTNNYADGLASFTGPNSVLQAPWAYITAVILNLLRPLQDIRSDGLVRFTGLNRVCQLWPSDWQVSTTCAGHYH